MRLSASHDALDAVKQLADRPAVSPLTAALRDAIGQLNQLAGEAAPAERVDLHVFPLDTLTPEFVKQALLERGWALAEIVVGSAQGEALVRRLLAGAPTVAEHIRLVPLSAEHRVEQADGWTLREVSG
jgi:hypothetical protein